MTEAPSPWLGGPGARWAQVLLFLLHVALVVALVVCALAYWRILPRVELPAWQRASVLAAIGAAIAVFGGRGVRIGAELWRAWRAFRAHQETSRHGR